jgi:hypothetical protein
VPASRWLGTRLDAQYMRIFEGERPTGLCAIHLLSEVLKDDNLLRLLFVKKKESFFVFFLFFIFLFPQLLLACFSNTRASGGDKARLIAQYLRSPEDTILLPY